MPGRALFGYSSCNPNLPSANKQANQSPRRHGFKSWALLFVTCCFSIQSYAQTIEVPPQKINLFVDLPWIAMPQFNDDGVLMVAFRQQRRTEVAPVGVYFKTIPLNGNEGSQERVMNAFDGTVAFTSPPSNDELIALGSQFRLVTSVFDTQASKEVNLFSDGFTSFDNAILLESGLERIWHGAQSAFNPSGTLMALGYQEGFGSGPIGNKLRIYNINGTPASDVIHLPIELLSDPDIVWSAQNEIWMASVGFGNHLLRYSSAGELIETRDFLPPLEFFMTKPKLFTNKSTGAIYMAYLQDNELLSNPINQAVVVKLSQFGIMEYQVTLDLPIEEIWNESIGRDFRSWDVVVSNNDTIIVAWEHRRSVYLTSFNKNGDQIGAVLNPIDKDQKQSFLPRMIFASNQRDLYLFMNVHNSLDNSGNQLEELHYTKIFAPCIATLTKRQDQVLCTGQSLQLEATFDSSTNPTAFQWLRDGQPLAGQTSAVLTIASVTEADSGLYSIQISGDSSCTETFEISQVSVDPAGITSSISIAANQTAFCLGDVAIFTATPQNPGSNPTYTWRINGNVVDGVTGTEFVTTTLADGDTVTCDLTNACAAQTTVTSNAITVSVNPITIPAVSITQNVNFPICAGEAVVFSAQHEAFPSPTYQWSVNGVPTGSDSQTFETNALADGDQVTVTINQLASPCIPRESAPLTASVEPTDPLEVTIEIFAVPNCDSETPDAVFTSSVVNPGNNPIYQWFQNGVPVALANNPEFSPETLFPGDVIALQVSNSCSSNSPAFSNQIVFNLPDSDADSVPDLCDNCPNTFNSSQVDTDNDGIGDACNDAVDQDRDEIADDIDNCPGTFNPTQADTDADGIGDACNDGFDADNDNWVDGFDNCPNVNNVTQIDTDGDGVGDACNDHLDMDHDEIADTLDNCPTVWNQSQLDTDGDGIGDACNQNVDSDGDNIADGLDNCPCRFNPSQSDRDTNGIGDACDVPGFFGMVAEWPSLSITDLAVFRGTCDTR